MPGNPSPNAQSGSLAGSRSSKMTAPGTRGQVGALSPAPFKRGTRTIPPDALAAGYVGQVASTWNIISSYLLITFSRLGGWRDSDANSFARKATSAVTGAQTQIAALTNGYLSNLIRLGGGVPGIVDLRGFDDRTLRGIPADQVYLRPFYQIWNEVDAGTPLPDAVAHARGRLRATIATDLQLARTHSARKTLIGAKGVIGYRRVPTEVKPCVLCGVAATRTYPSIELMPIHPFCFCSFEPLFGKERPVQISPGVHQLVADRLGIERLSSSGDGYQELVEVREHGEIGPMLTVRGHHFEED